MKKYIIILLLSLGVHLSGTAQRYDESQNFNLSVGYLKKGFTAIVGYENLFSRHDALAFQLAYSYRTEVMRTANDKAKFSDYTVTGLYKRYFNFKRIFPYVGGGVFVGYEKFNNKTDYSETIIIDRDNGMLYGIHPEIGIEFNIRRISLNLAFSPKYEFNFKEFLPVVSAGLKFFF